MALLTLVAFVLIPLEKPPDVVVTSQVLLALDKLLNGLKLDPLQLVLLVEDKENG
jgi:hypothetical protein